MKHLTIRETRQALSHLDHLLATEGEVTIVKRGKAIARVVRVGGPAPVPSHRDLRRKMPRMKKDSDKLIREDRDAR